MKTFSRLTLIFGALALSSTVCRAQVGAGQAGDVVYTLTVADATATLTNSLYFYNFNNGDSFGYVTGDFPTISGGPNVVNVGNPFNDNATSFGLLGIDNITTGATTNQSIYVGFSTASTLPINESFNTFFAPFFAEHTDLTLDESTIVAALQDPDIFDADTNDESGRVIYQFRDYVIGLSDSGTATAAPIDTGMLTLVHFSDGTAFGDSEALQVPPNAVPEPGTWAALLAGGGVAGWVYTRRRLA